jgi:VacB/RNase II family 3'-5' exoribonuclease
MMAHKPFDLAVAARQEMIARGFDPDFPPGTDQQLAVIETRPGPAPGGDVRDMRNLLWSSIDNDTSRDLDQAEVAERVGEGIRIRIAVADVDSAVSIGSPIDKHAASQTTTVYASVSVFSMLPERLSTDLTSLNENADRLAVIVELTVAADGSISSPSIYRAVVRNHAQLAYNGVGSWLEGQAEPPPKIADSADLAAQLKLQDEAAQILCERRHRLGALDFDRVEAEPVVSDGQVQSLGTRHRNRASRLIEDFMVAANGVMAQTLTSAGRSLIRRIVKTPERWPRIVELASRYGGKLPRDPDSGALNEFLMQMRKTDQVHYADVSLAVIKLMGKGEYALSRAGDTDQGHFALAARDYTHSTAPNRRFADLVTQRLIKAALAKQPAPYSDPQLDSIARNCTLKEDAENKVERIMTKRIAAVALVHRIGQSFAAVVTGVTPKGVFVRVFDPPVEGLLIHGQERADVGDELRVKLVSTNPQLGYLDFAREA